MGTNILWWMAEVGIDGLRIDTYTYGQQAAMAAMTKRVSNLSRLRCSRKLARAWNKRRLSRKWVRLGPDHRPGRRGNAWHFAMQEAVEHGEGWEHGIGKVYEVLVEDFRFNLKRW